jgi:hypothetical protein
MITLPQKLSDMKDDSSVFFVDLYVLHCTTGELYFAALDVDVPWFIPGTTTAVTYVAQPIQRGSLTQSTDDKVDNVDLQISDVSEAFRSVMFQSFDFRGTMVDIVQIAYPGSLTDGTQFKCVFHGYMDTPGLDESKGTFATTLMAVVPNMTSCRSLQLSCNAWFGDSEECGATVTTVAGTVATGSTQTVIYDATLVQGENYWKSGVITIGFESKKVMSSTAGSVTVNYPFYTAPSAGTSYTLENGCDQSYPDCVRHGNTVNFSGFKAIPFECVVKD